MTLEELTEALFLRNPYDPPEKLFELATRYLDYKNAVLAGQIVNDLSEQKAKEALERLAINSTKA
jgi:hypothetical protein